MTDAALLRQHGSAAASAGSERERTRAISRQMSCASSGSSSTPVVGLVRPHYPSRSNVAPRSSWGPSSASLG